MFAPIAIGFAPNFQRDDVVLSLKLLFGLMERKDVASQEKKVVALLKTVSKATAVSLFSSGRAALMFALKALCLQKGDEVLLQAFTCIAVPNCVQWAGLKPVFVDCDPKTYNLDVSDLKKKISKKTRVIIIQNTFGIPAPVSEILDLAKKHSLYIVNDCAHALGESLDGVGLGSLGDVSVFSFGRDKILSCVSGGATTTSIPAIAEKLSNYEQRLVTPKKVFVIKQLLYPIIYSISIPLYNIGLGKFFLWLSARLGLLSKAVLTSERKGFIPEFIDYKLSPSLLVLLLNQFEKLPLFTNHRHMVAKLFIKSLKLPIPVLPYLRVPFKTTNKEKLLAEAKKISIHLGDWYRAVVYPSGQNPNYHHIDCKQARTLAQHTINLPTHIHISVEKAFRIIRFLKTYQEK